jgi:hypothetical protein
VGLLTTLFLAAAAVEVEVQEQTSGLVLVVERPAT